MSIEEMNSDFCGLFSKLFDLQQQMLHSFLRIESRLDQQLQKTECLSSTLIKVLSNKRN